jgi:predicted transcriptional regulator
MKERRGKLKRITELLVRARIPKKPTELMRKGRIDYNELMEYVNVLLKAGLIEIIPHIEGKTKLLYRTTEDGNEFVNHASTCFDWIEDDYIKKIEREIKVF